MRQVACVFVLGLLGVVPAIGRDPNGRLPQQFQLQPLPPGGLPAPPPPATGYTAPKADGAVVELLDEGVEPLFAQLNNDGGGEAGTIAREDRDVFAGVEAVRVTPMQKYRNTLPGWDFKIVEKPANAGEFRYLRFAWKKFGGTGIMIQLHGTDSSQWNHRFFAGRNSVGWSPATGVSDKLPAAWELVTRDLFKEFGSFTISGFALTAMDGNSALFDHMLLGRTIEDLDKATDTALGKAKPAGPLAGKERDALWADLIGLDAKKAAAALRLFLATAPEQVAFIRDRLSDLPDKDQAARIHKLVLDLDADNFDTRDKATEELVKIGSPAIDVMREMAKSAPNDEVRFRARVILKKLGGGATSGPVGKAGRLSRVVRVLERAATPEARTLLDEIAEGKLAAEVSADAKAALARLPKTP